MNANLYCISYRAIKGYVFCHIAYISNVSDVIQDKLYDKIHDVLHEQLYNVVYETQKRNERHTIKADVRETFAKVIKDEMIFNTAKMR